MAPVCSLATPAESLWARAEARPFVARRLDANWLPADEERWQLHQVDVDELAWYCPACGAREFGDD
jgi:hypothetical protein